MQTWEERSPSTVYEELCVFRKEKKNTDKSVKGGTSVANVITKLVLILSNWSFVRDNKENPQKIKCSLHNVTVGLKLASTEFRSPNKQQHQQDYNQQYDFDKNGLVLPYPAFLSLLKDSSFVDEFMTKVEQRYITDTGDNLTKAAGSGSKKKVPPKASLRRQYDEAFPELRDGETSHKKKTSTNADGGEDYEDDDDDDNDDADAGENEGAGEDLFDEDREIAEIAQVYNEAEETEATQAVSTDFKRPAGRPRGKTGIKK